MGASYSSEENKDVKTETTPLFPKKVVLNDREEKIQSLFKDIRKDTENLVDLVENHKKNLSEQTKRDIEMKEKLLNQAKEMLGSHKKLFEQSEKMRDQLYKNAQREARRLSEDIKCNVNESEEKIEFDTEDNKVNIYLKTKFNEEERKNLLNQFNLIFSEYIFGDLSQDLDEKLYEILTTDKNFILTAKLYGILVKESERFEVYSIFFDQLVVGYYSEYLKRNSKDETYINEEKEHLIIYYNCLLRNLKYEDYIN
jgi:F0F1-type ATP synthase membrane subunit b/b'